MADGYYVPDYPTAPIPVGGFVQSPTGVLVPRDAPPETVIAWIEDAASEGLARRMFIYYGGDPEVFDTETHNAPPSIKEWSK